MYEKNTDIQFDAFSPQHITPSSSIPGEVVLIDNYGSRNPLQPLSDCGSVKLFHMTVFFLMQGTVRFLINGKEVVLSGGQTLTTLPDSELQFCESADEDRFLLFVIYPDLLKKAYDDIYLNYDLTKYSAGYLLASCNEEEMSLYQILYNELKKECTRPNYEYRMAAIRAYLNALLINNLNLYSMQDRIDVDPNSRQYDVFQRFLRTLNQYARSERTVQFYADALDISPKYLSFVTLQYSSKNASQWIADYIIQAANTMMSIHHMSAIETAEKLNFSTSNSFNRFYKRVTGITPKDFIKSVK